MTALSQIAAGGRILASAVAGVAPLAAVKPLDESVTSSTTLQDDDALLLSLPASTTWMFVALLLYTGDATGSGGIKFTFTIPSGGSLNWSQLYAPSSASAFNVSGSGTGSGQVRSAVTNGGAQMPAWILGTVTVSVTAGDLQLQWAQNASDATATVMKAGSFLSAWQVG